MRKTNYFTIIFLIISLGVFYTAPFQALSFASSYIDPTTGIEMVLVKGGCYQMGDTFGDGDSNEKPVHEVCVDDFYLGKYEVKNSEFKKFIDETGYRTRAEEVGKGWGISREGATDWGLKEGINWRHPLWPTDSIENKMDHPVVQVSWYDTQEFFKWLNQKTEREYRLPTEAEWEYAARSGGKAYKYSWGNGPPSGNISDESAKLKFPSWKIWEGYDDGFVYTSPTGRFTPNELGLFDMTGNVWERCQDVYNSEAYKKHSRNNPIYPGSGDYRVIRGGGWINEPRSLRVSDRSHDAPDSSRSFLGFRLVGPK